MSSHTPHPDSHEHGLADDCPRCGEHAQHPFESLDDANLLNLLSRVNLDLPARSDNERKAMDVIEDTIRRYDRIVQLERSLI